MGMKVGGEEGGAVADINMIPLIDVLLVLLIIFMVITPLTPKGLEALIPQPPPPGTPPSTGPDRTVVIIVNKDRSMQLNTEPVSEDSLAGRLLDVFKTRAERVCFVKGDPGLASALATRLAGSADLYQSGGRAPYHSVNFVVSHDGFTLWDLVSYQVKRNEANGELNLDGDNHNLSWNHGAEGPTADPAILALRRRQAKNCMALLMVSQGVPMVLAGDECLRTQGGNNNAYCQDNETSWFDWGLVRENAEMVRFFKELVAFRRRHPALRRKRFFAGVDHDGDQMPDISWHGLELGAPDWSEKSRFLAFLLDGSEAGGAEPDDDIYVAMNSLDEPLSFALPYFKEGVCWRRVVDTSKRPPRDVMLEDRALRLRGQQIGRAHV